MGHAPGLPPDVSGGAMFPFLELFADMETGMAVVEGGAQRLPQALAAVLADHGGEVRTGAGVDRVLCRDGRAVGVRTADGGTLRAWRAAATTWPRTSCSGRCPDTAATARRHPAAT
ncbi:FAD-dependent oxidoreductase [Actinacidiphila glaucinigra]